MDNLLNKPVSPLNLIPESTPVTPSIIQPITTTPQEAMGKGIVAGVKTKQGNTRGSNKPIDDNTPVATVNLPGVEVVAKRYVANIGGKEYGFSSEEKKNAFVDKVNKAMTDSLTQKKYGYNPNKNWYRTKIG